MPARKRPKPQPVELDPVSRFGILLRESAEREEAERDRVRRERDDAKAAAKAKVERAEALKATRVALDRAIEDVRRANSTRRGVAEADAVWRAAKAHLIELETGAPPSWTPSTGSGGSTDDDSTPADADDPGDAGDPASSDDPPGGDTTD